MGTSAVPFPPDTLEIAQKHEMAARGGTAAFPRSVLQWQHGQDSEERQKSNLEGD